MNCAPLGLSVRPAEAEIMINGAYIAFEGATETLEHYNLEPAELARKLYEELPEGNYQRGFKCPGHFSRRSMRYFRQYFSKTKLIVGLRHPVRWFER